MSDQTETTEAPRLGIYFNLPPIDYHEDPALGSSDVKTLAFEPHEYWWKSAMNPARPETNDYTPAKVFGSALHYRILLGQEAYDKRYRKGGGAKTTVPDASYDKVLIEELGRKDFDNWTKESKAICLRKANIELLTNTQHREVELAAAMITKNPNLKQAFSNGAPECAIFWEDESGIRKKALIDYLKLKASVDVKSFRPHNSRTQEFDKSVFKAMSDYMYYVQAAHYMSGRNTMWDHIDAGRVYNAEGIKEEWLVQCSKETNPPFLFVFYKASGAPLAKGYGVRWASPLHRDGLAICSMADANYKKFTERYGTEAWVMDEPIHEISDGEIWVP